VRVRPLSIQANSTNDYRLEGNVANSGTSAFAKSLADLSSYGIINFGNSENEAILGLANVFFCTRSDSDRSGRIYMQFPAGASGHALASGIEQAIGQAATKLSFVDGLRGMESMPLGRSPTRSEVRFYSYDDQLAAFDAARYLEKFLGHPVLIKYMPRLVKRKTGHLPLEIWVGEKEPALGNRT